MEQEDVARNLEQQSPRPVLILYSHARRPPLVPPPDLKYDLRGIPNPPRALRDSRDGRSKRLRGHLLAEPKFKQKLQAVESDICQAMQHKIEKWELMTNQQENQVRDAVADANPTKKEEEEEEEEQERSAEIEAEPAYDNRANTKHELPFECNKPENGILLRVGCYCALGHHRSVAFVHELAQLSWNQDWNVEVRHRDLEERRSGGVRERQKAKFRPRDREDAGGWSME